MPATHFTIQHKLPLPDAQNAVYVFLTTHKFEQKTADDGRVFWELNDPILYGRMGLTCGITDATVEIDGWIGKYTKPTAVDNGYVKSVGKNHFRELMAELEASLQSQAGIQPGTVPTQLQEQAAKSRRRNGTFAIVGFVVALIGLILAMFPRLSPGGVLILLALGFSAYGLRSSRKGLALAGIVISLIDLMLLVLKLTGILR